MDNTLHFKGYYGSVEISTEDDLLYGKLLFIRPLVNYEAKTAKELEDAFQHAVDDYLDICSEKDIAPEKACKGSLNIRLGQDLHLSASVLAHQRATSLNELIKSAVSEKVQQSRMAH